MLVAKSTNAGSHLWTILRDNTNVSHGLCNWPRTWWPGCRPKPGFTPTAKSPPAD